MEAVQGSLWLASVRLTDEVAQEASTLDVLCVADTKDDLCARLRWALDIPIGVDVYVMQADKMRGRAYVVSRRVQPMEAPANHMQRPDGSVPVPQQSASRVDLPLFAVGCATSIRARDESHALRRVGSALMASGAPKTAAERGAQLPDGAQILVEQISEATGIAMPRDVSTLKVRAHIVRG